MSKANKSKPTSANKSKRTSAKKSQAQRVEKTPMTYFYLDDANGKKPKGNNTNKMYNNGKPTSSKKNKER